MKAKWYFSALVIVFAFLGICHNQISSPNQEILVQFNSNEVTAEQSQNAVATIKQQLQNFGVDSIHVLQGKNGELKISYHSSIDVKSIRKTLSKVVLGLDVSSIDQNKKHKKAPSKKHHRDYNLDVYELYKTSDSNNSAGKYIVIAKQDYDRFLNSNSYPFPNQTNTNEVNGYKEPSNKFDGDIAVVINTTSYSIPEVRAGPNTVGNL
ncbi:MAG: hypothetical protein R2783_05805 [Gelidibacter sp.]